MKYERERKGGRVKERERGKKEEEEELNII